MDSVANIALSKLEKKMEEENIYGYVASFEKGVFKTTPILEPFEIVTETDMKIMRSLIKEKFPNNGK